MQVSRETAIQVMRTWFSRPSTAHKGTGVVWENNMPRLAAAESDKLLDDDFLVDLYQKITGAKVSHA